MRISAIKTYTLPAPEMGRPNAACKLVKIETDEGISGWAEINRGGGFQPGEHAIVQAAVQTFADYLLGQDPFRIEYHWQNLFDRSRFSAGGEYLCAVSGLEMAMWDIVGWALNTPCYNLWGGACRDRIRVYGHLWGEDIEDRVVNALKMVDWGYTAIKWDPFGHATNPMDNPVIDTARAKDAINQVRAVREAVGPGIDICVEAHGAFNVNSAIRMGRALEEYNPFFYEEPVPPPNVDAMVKVAQAVKIPIATGEKLYSLHDFRELLEKQAAEILQPDLDLTGGLLATRKIAAMAEAYLVPLAPHNPLGPVNTAASVQLCAAIRNFIILETLTQFHPARGRPDWWDWLLEEPIQVVDGYIKVPTGPGLGMSVNEKRLAEYQDNW
ncbi:MAG: galactonate dehydratase [Chloroflexi bacterium]|nr:galactonate dehydratase [Chloroflexota bacterium]MCL5026426.1 galactonate dehydratase [Chloroflexota bacterium]